MRKLLTTAAMTFALGSAAALAADGAAVWKANCGKCHGETGMADTPPAKALKAPAIAGNAKIAGMAPADIVAAIKAKPVHGSLKKVPDADLEAAASHAKELAAKK